MIFRSNKYKKIKYRFTYLTIFLFILFAVTQESNAQNHCGALLKKAEKLYDNGNIEKIPQILSGCLKKGLTQEEKTHAYKLIINSYLYSEDLYFAEQTMLEFLKFDPEYEPDKSIDKAEFISLYQKFETLPTYSLGFYLGANFSGVNVINEYSLASSHNYTYSSGGAGFQFGGRFSKTLTPPIDLNAELGILYEKYDYSEQNFEFTETTLSETHFLLNLPLGVSYKRVFNQFHPFIAAGVIGNYLLSASATPERIYTDNSHKDITGSDIDLTNHRQHITLSAFFGIGVRYKIPNGYFFFTARHVFGLMNQVKKETRYDNTELIYQYFYVDNDFRISNYTFSVGYMYMFYKPRKK